MSNINWSPDFNPYNFVPFGISIKLPSPKESNEKEISGKIECVLTCLTPLFIGGKREEQQNAPTKIYFFESNGQITIPASSLRGMVRSVIEAITQSCFSVFDGERLSYRLPTSLAKDLRAGIIEQMPADGKPGMIREMDRAWIAMANDSGLVKDVLVGKGNTTNYKIAKLAGNEHSGNKGKFNIQTIYRLMKTKKGKKIRVGPFKVATSYSSGKIEGILKITGRSIPKRKKRERVFFNSGNLYEFGIKEVYEYNRILEEQLETWEKDTKAFDLTEKKKLSVGSLVYFKEDNNKATKISRVEIPRVLYETSREDLLPDKFNKCSDIKNLCTACSLFGFVEEKKSKVSRLLFSDAEWINGPGLHVNFIELKPLGSPHPTSYNFYLYDPDDSKIVRNYDGFQILNNRGDKWGTKGKIKLRGRKFYFHQPNEKNLNEYCDYSEETRQLRNLIQPVLPDTQFKFSIHFKNLTEAEVGLLYYAIILENDLAHKLGMGKAIGLGSVKISIKEIKYFDKKDWLTWSITSTKKFSNSDCDKEVTEKVNKFLKAVKKLTGNDFYNLPQISALKKILNFSNAQKKYYPSPEGFKWYMFNKDKSLKIL